MRLIAFCFLLVTTLVSARAQAQDWDRIHRDGLAESERQLSPSDRMLIEKSFWTSAEVDTALVSAFEHYSAGRSKAAARLFRLAEQAVLGEKTERSATAHYFKAKAVEVDMQRDPAFARALWIAWLKEHNGRWTQLAEIDAQNANGFQFSFQMALFTGRLPTKYREDAFASCQWWYGRLQAFLREAQIDTSQMGHRPCLREWPSNVPSRFSSP